MNTIFLLIEDSGTSPENYHRDALLAFKDGEKANQTRELLIEAENKFNQKLMELRRRYKIWQADNPDPVMPLSSVLVSAQEVLTFEQWTKKRDIATATREELRLNFRNHVLEWRSRWIEEFLVHCKELGINPEFAHTAIGYDFFLSQGKSERDLRDGPKYLVWQIEVLD